MCDGGTFHISNAHIINTRLGNNNFDILSCSNKLANHNLNNTKTNGDKWYLLVSISRQHKFFFAMSKSKVIVIIKSNPIVTSFLIHFMSCTMT